MDGGKLAEQMRRAKITQKRHSPISKPNIREVVKNTSYIDKLLHTPIYINGPLIDEIFIKNIDNVPTIYSDNAHILTMIKAVEKSDFIPGIDNRYIPMSVNPTDIESGKIFNYGYIYDTLSEDKSIFYSLDIINFDIMQRYAKVLNILSKVSEIRVTRT